MHLFRCPQKQRRYSCRYSYRHQYECSKVTQYGQWCRTQYWRETRASGYEPEQAHQRHVEGVKRTTPLFSVKTKRWLMYVGLVTRQIPVFNMKLDEYISSSILSFSRRPDALLNLHMISQAQSTEEFEHRRQSSLTFLSRLFGSH